ncbi:MarR family transcriptional regulator [Nitratireductor rhodophyticola]|uniref:MarR family transcriptional regulator n=1 Tax=Nitratireductor rhodophyticola TaxID=2854036 RepID=A0ABS7R6S3_9HYPH|nr:MarR family transcriptional regulator [Nitratireductor rhodophyticola]MBY8916087.1 MarR family transcriptional regulator [Nitratireductor rhodophyticola]MBY8921450.1 MarR family transcriptional regulator [Nitratireductor rhodophyticola]MEC9243905.1 MarR family transcriptional regulator [Pseudomonadota bacterium]WPZ15771.1 MarR family transcriptional regulator [Nitratireductor rhodophyticola]
MSIEKTGEDHVDRLRAQWARELPDLDTSPMSILGRIYRLSMLVRPGIEETFAAFDLDRGEFDVIATLRRAGPPYRLTPTELYKSLMITSGGLTHRLKRLEKAGLVERIPSPEDGRSMIVGLTGTGIKRAEEAFRADMESELALFASMPAARRELLAELLRELTQNVTSNLADREN